MSVSYRDNELPLNDMCVRGRNMTSVGSGCIWVHICSRRKDVGREFRPGDRDQS